MTKSTPDDLAVAFRSLARRQREALGDADPASVGGMLGEIDHTVGAAASVLGVPADAASVADALEQRPADEWDDATLDALRGHADSAAGILRRLSAMTGSDDPDDGD